MRAQLERGEKSAGRYCENPVLNQLLSYYAQWAGAEGIRFSARAFLPDTPPERRMGLMVALCNVLKNAIHACMKIPPPGPRRVDVVLWSRGRQLFLEAGNTYTGKITVDPDTGLPNSAQPDHGMGFQRLAVLAGARPEWFAENGVFKISLLL